MKKILRISFLLFAFLLFSGFTKYNFNMTVKEDRSVELELNYAYKLINNDETPIDPSSYGIIQESSLNKLKEKGFSITSYNDDDKKNWFGVSISKKYSNIESLTKESDIELQLVLESLDSEINIEDSQLFQYKDGHYKAIITVDLSSLIKSIKNDKIDIDGDLDLSLNLNLPQRSIANNASKVSDDGKSLTWNLSSTDSNRVVFDFGFENNETVPTKSDSKFFTYLLYGVCVIAIIVAIVLLMNRRKKNRKEPITKEENEININIEPVAPIITNPEPADNTESDTGSESNEPVVQPAIELNNNIEEPINNTI